MALPTSGAISLSQFRTTFGGSKPDSVSEYRRGGSNVADNAINVNIPTSGTASFSDYYGGAGTQTRNISINMDYNINNKATGLRRHSFLLIQLVLRVAFLLVRIALHTSLRSTLVKALLLVQVLKLVKTRILGQHHSL
jgi:hypothetical protein